MDDCLVPANPRRPVVVDVDGLVFPACATRARGSDTRGGVAQSCGDACVHAELIALLADLQLYVTTYVYQRRAEGAPVERVLPEVRCLVREAESCERWTDPDDTLLSQAVRWSLEAYHDHSPPATATTLGG